MKKDIPTLASFVASKFQVDDQRKKKQTSFLRKNNKNFFQMF